MKIRILERNDSHSKMYYPQKFTFFGWVFFKWPAGTQKSFDTLEEAEDYVLSLPNISTRVVKKFKLKIYK